MADDKYDAELAAVLVALAPLGERALQFVDVQRREFRVAAALDQPWSTGERMLVALAAALWNPVHADKFDVTDLVMYVDGAYFTAAVNAMAARRRENIATDYLDALDRVSGENGWTL